MKDSCKILSNPYQNLQTSLNVISYSEIFSNRTLIKEKPVYVELITRDKPLGGNNYEKSTEFL